MFNASLAEVGVPSETIHKISLKVETIRRNIVVISQPIGERLGGESFLNKAVDLFYKKVMLDERINHFFVKVDKESHKRMFIHYLESLVGEPTQ